MFSKSLLSYDRISSISYKILEIVKETLFELFCTNPLFLQIFLEYISDHAFILGDKIKHYVNKSIRKKSCIILIVKVKNKILIALS